MNESRKFNMKSGFSLMELIIVIVIIGILISAVVGLNGQRETAKISAAEQIVIQLMNGTQSWAIMEAKEDYATFTGANGVSTLVTAGILPADFDAARANPWAGAITITGSGAGTVKNHYVIGLSNLPASSCNALINKFSNKAFATPTCTADVFEATF